MKKTGSKATKPALKSTLKNKAKKAVKKGTRGGSRKGAGKKPREGEFKQLHIDTPACLIEALNGAGITNKTAFVNYLLANELKDYNINKGLKMQAENLADQLKNKWL